MADKRFAILIASSRFPEEPGLTELRCPENDVDALAGVLSSPDFGQFSEVVPLKNRPSHEVLERLETLLHEAGRDDLVLVYFSGHGKLNASGQLCLATANTKLRTLGSTSIPVERIKSFFDAADTKKKILILDCCYSGAAGAEFVKGGVDDQLQIMSQGQGTFIMTASTAFQTAVEKEDDSCGLFTKHLVAGIRSGEADRDEDGLISVGELYKHVYEKVRAEGAQVPMKWGLQTQGSMIIARSGRDAKEKRRQALRAKLLELAAQGYLSDSILSTSLKLISSTTQEMTVKGRECYLLIEQLGDGRISTGNFVERWMTICLAPELPVPLRLKPLLFILAALSCATAGAGWYFVRDRIAPELPKMAVVSVRRLPVQSVSPSTLSPLPALPPPPKMGTISVSRQAVPSLSQTTLRPLPEAEKTPQKGKTIGQYIDNDDGTVTDTKSGLMWKRCSEGLSGADCEKGKIETYKWDEAVNRFKNVAYAGYADWRLPTIDELKTLVQCSKGKDKNGDCKNESESPTINQQAFPNTGASVVWSGSPHAGYSDGAWYVHFGYGYFYYGNRNYNYAVRLVRGGQ